MPDKISTIIVVKGPDGQPQVRMFNAAHIVTESGTTVADHIANSSIHVTNENITKDIEDAMKSVLGIIRDGKCGGSLEDKYFTLQLIGKELDRVAAISGLTLEDIVNMIATKTDPVIKQSSDVTEAVAVMRKELDEFLKVSFVQKTLYWKHYNVRAIGERGTVEEQGFTQDGSIPITYVDLVAEGTPQTTICLPAPEGGGTGLFNSARMSSLFDDSLWDDMEKYGAAYSGVSMLGSEHMVNGNAGAFTGVLDRFKNGNPYARFVIAFRGMPGSDGNSYVYVTSTSTSHITSNILLDGSNGLPKVQVGEWFEWEITIPPNFDTSTRMDIRINGVMIPPKLIYTLTTFSGLGSCLKVGNWFTTVGGNYSYHTNVGVTIMQEPSHKVFTNEDLDNSDIFTVVTPEGLFHLTCEAKDINPLRIGHTLQIVAINKYGTLSFIGNPNFLINGIQSNTIPIMKATQLTGINTATATNNYAMDLSTLLLPQFSVE